MKLEDKIREVIITIKHLANKDNVVNVGTKRIMEIILEEENENLYSLQRPDNKNENYKKQNKKN